MKIPILHQSQSHFSHFSFYLHGDLMMGTGQPLVPTGFKKNFAWNSPNMRQVKFGPLLRPFFVTQVPMKVKNSFLTDFMYLNQCSKRCSILEIYCPMLDRKFVVILGSTRYSKQKISVYSILEKLLLDQALILMVVGACMTSFKPIQTILFVVLCL